MQLWLASDQRQPAQPALVHTQLSGCCAWAALIWMQQRQRQQRRVMAWRQTPCRWAARVECIC